MPDATLLPPHLRVLDLPDGRIVLATAADEVLFEAAPDGYGPAGEVQWASAASKQLAWSRAVELANTVTTAHASAERR